MPKNRNNSSTKIVAKDKLSSKDKQKNISVVKKGVKDTKSDPNVEEYVTRSRSKRSHSNSREEQRSPKARKTQDPSETTQTCITGSSRINKLNKSNKRVIAGGENSQNICDGISKDSNVEDAEVIVGSSRSLIKSIKNGKIGRGKKAAVSLDENNPVEEAANAVLVEDNSSQEFNAHDGIHMTYNSSEDDYSEAENSDSQSSESGEISDQSDSGDDTSENGEESTSEEELDRNDPRVQKLLKQLMDEEADKKKKRHSHKSSKNTPKGVNQITKNANMIKSPSDTTLYAPALCKQSGNSQVGIVRNLMNNSNTPVSSKQISEFVERIRRDESERRSQSIDRSSPRNGTAAREENSTNPVANLVVEAERFKASIEKPSGNNERNVDVLNESVLELIELLKKKVDVDNDNDDDFMHVTCHIDSNLRTKIGRGEFVELERLLPKTRNQVMNVSSSGSNSEIQLVRRDGASFVIPETVSKENKITNIRKWEQAFRVYTAIYSEVNTERSAEIWQYVHIINTAAMSYTWENVAFYDYTFRQLMARKPRRSWAKIYTQMWNLAMTDQLHKNNNGTGGQNSGNSKSSDWRQRCCWRFNKGKCSKWNCKYDHRCKGCGSYSHGLHQCNSQYKKGDNGGRKNNEGRKTVSPKK